MNVFGKKGIQPVHLFDVWGVVLDANKRGLITVDIYKELAEKTGISPEVSETTVNDYMKLLEGDPSATGTRKRDIITALQGPLDKAGIKIPYAGSFLEDGLYAIGRILDSGEHVSIFSSGNAEDMRAEMPREIGSRIGKMYDASVLTFPTINKTRTKAEPAAFSELAQLEGKLGNYIVSHTADELPELVSALASRVIGKDGLVYVNRNNSNSAQKVLKAGIGHYVDSLRAVDYAKMSKPRA